MNINVPNITNISKAHARGFSSNMEPFESNFVSDYSCFVTRDVINFELSNYLKVTAPLRRLALIIVALKDCKAVVMLAQIQNLTSSLLDHVRRLEHNLVSRPIEASSFDAMAHRSAWFVEGVLPYRRSKFIVKA